MRSRLCLLLVLAAVPLAGCGSGGSSGSSGQGADPAKLAPASAPIYVEAVVRPDGSLGDGARDALKKLLHTSDPGAKLTGLLDRAGADDGLRWKDVEPWLGKRVGLFLTAGSAPGAQGAVIADTTDTGKAQSTLDTIAERKAARDHEQLTKQTYKGVALRVDAQGDQATGIVDDYALLGSVAGVHQAIDVAKGARPLSDVADYSAARAAVHADDGLALAYVIPQGFADTLAKLGASSSGTPFSNPRFLTILRQALARGGRVAAASLHADGSAVRLDAAAIGAPASSSSTGAADALAALPSDAWFAAGIGDLGTTLSRGLAQLRQLAGLAGHGQNVAAMLAGFKARTGIDVQRDLLSWMGDGAVYAHGSGLLDIGGALTIKSTDPAKSHKAVLLLARGLRRAGAQVRAATVSGYDSAIEVHTSQVPISLFIAAGGDHFSIGINPQALTDALHPSSTLGASATYRSATKALGGDLKPVFVLDTPTIVNLLEGFGVGNQPGFAQVKPYLDALGPISAGSSRDGNTAKVALAVGLR